MNRWLLEDSRGDPSWTLTLVTPAFVAATVKFLAGGIILGPLGTVPPMTGTEYAAAIVAILGVWVAREYTDKPLDLTRSQGGG